MIRSKLQEVPACQPRNERKSQHRAADLRGDCSQRQQEKAKCKGSCMECPAPYTAHWAKSGQIRVLLTACHGGLRPCIVEVLQQRPNGFAAWIRDGQRLIVQATLRHTGCDAGVRRPWPAWAAPASAVLWLLATSALRQVQKGDAWKRRAITQGVQHLINF